MKKTMKIIGCVLLCCFIMGQIVNGVLRPMTESSFAYQVSVANRNCPIPLALGKGSLTSIELIDGYLTYKVSYDKEFGHIFSNVQDEAQAKEGIMMSFLCINAQGESQGNVLMDKLIEENCGMKVIVEESMVGRKEFIATVEDIKVFREKVRLNPHEALHRILEINIEAEREQFPMAIEVGMVMTDYHLEGENLVLTIELDEDIYDVEALYGVRNEMKQGMMQTALTEPDVKSLFDMCKVTHTGFVIRFVGDQSKYGFDVVISSDEIRRFIQTPASIR